MKSEESLLGLCRFCLRNLVCTGMLASCLSAGASVYTVTLPDGTTNTLAEAFSNGYVTGENSPTMAGLYAAEDLRVTGGGRLEINVDLKSAGFTGEVHVLPGATLRLTAMGALGDTAHGTFVEDGATLETECLDTSANSKLDFAGEKLSFAGEGVNGVGALVARTPSKQERNGVWGGTVLTMTGNAKIAAVAGYQDFPCNSANNSLDMNGYTLTIAEVPNAAGTRVGGFCLRPVVANPGHIIVDRCGVSINDVANLGGDARNTFTIINGASLELYGIVTAGRKKWTLVKPAANTREYSLQASRDGGIWDGPIQINSAEIFSLASQQVGSTVYTNSSVFLGPITATDTLTFKNGSSALAHPSLALNSPANSFGKGLTIKDADLHLNADGALPASCGTCRVETVSIDFDRSVANYSLPVLEVNGSASVATASGSWQGVVKKGAGALAYEEGVTFPSLDLKAGSFAMRLPAEKNHAFYAGLHYGYSTNYIDWFRSGYANIANKVFYNRDDPTVTNRVVYDVSDLNVIRTQYTGAGTWYQGYVWNSSNAPVTWRFAMCCTMRGFLRINGKMVIEQAANAVTFGNAVLQPGANSLDFRLGSGQVKNTSYTVVSPANNSLWTHGYGFAYCTTSTTSTNSADFAELSDPGDGSVLRIYAEGTDAWNEQMEAYSNDVQNISRVTAVNGTSIDLGTSRWRIGILEGCPSVTASESPYRMPTSLTVANRWMVDGSALAAGGAWNCGTKLVFAEGAVIEIGRAKVALSKAGRVAAVVSSQEIEGLPTAEGADGSSFRVVKSADAKTLYLEYIPNGTLVIFR